MLLIMLLDKRENGKRDDIFSCKTHLDTSEDVDYQQFWIWSQTFITISEI